MSGTSMACPHVSGAAALLLEASPDAKPAQVRQSLLDSAQDHALRGLKQSDVNKLVFVGAGGAPILPPTPAPPVTACTSDTSSGPDGNGDCNCEKDHLCYEGDSYKCKYSGTGWFG